MKKVEAGWAAGVEAGPLLLKHPHTPWTGAWVWHTGSLSQARVRWQKAVRSVGQPGTYLRMWQQCLAPQLQDSMLLASLPLPVLTVSAAKPTLFKGKSNALAQHPSVGCRTKSRAITVASRPSSLLAPLCCSPLLYLLSQSLRHWSLTEFHSYKLVWIILGFRSGSKRSENWTLALPCSAAHFAWVWHFCLHISSSSLLGFFFLS